MRPRRTGSAFDVTFQLNSNGATFSDKGNNSHGDSLNSPKFTTALNADKNFAGTFSLDTTDVSTDPDLSKKNPQRARSRRRSARSRSRSRTAW